MQQHLRTNSDILLPSKTNLAQQPLPYRSHSGGYTYSPQQIHTTHNIHGTHHYHPPPQYHYPSPAGFNYHPPENQQFVSYSSPAGLNYPMAVMASESELIHQVAGLNSVPRDLVYVVKFKRTQRSFILGSNCPRDVKVS